MKNNFKLNDKVILINNQTQLEKGSKGIIRKIEPASVLLEITYNKNNTQLHTGGRFFKKYIGYYCRYDNIKKIKTRIYKFNF